MSLEVLLQAAQFVDHSSATVSGGAVTQSSPALTMTRTSVIMEDSRSSAAAAAVAACQPTLSTSRSEIAGSTVYFDHFKGDCSRFSHDGYSSQQTSRAASRPDSPSDSETGSASTTSGYEMDLGGDASGRDRSTSAASSRRQSGGHRSSGSSRLGVPAADFWKKRGSHDKSRRLSMKHSSTENRSVHNVLEKNRRAHLKDCFESLKQEVLEGDDEKKASHLAVLKSAVRCIQQLRKESEKLMEDTDTLSKERISGQIRLQELKREILARSPAFDIADCLRDNHDEVDSQITCTAPGSPPPGRYSTSPRANPPPLARSITPTYDAISNHTRPSSSPNHLYPINPVNQRKISLSRSTTPRLDRPRPLSLRASPESSGLPQDLTTTSTPQPARCRKKAACSERPPSDVKQRRAAVKISVAKILHEARTASPASQPAQPVLPLSATLSTPSSSTGSANFVLSSPATAAVEPGPSEPRKHLPLKLRILQRQQEGLLTPAPDTSEEKADLDDSPAPSPKQEEEDTLPNSSIVVKPPWPTPMPAMFGQGGFWTTDGTTFSQMPAFFAPPNGFPGGPLYQMNQFLVPISAMNGMTAGGLMGQLPPGLIMVPANGAQGPGALFQCGQLPAIHQLPTFPKGPPS